MLYEKCSEVSPAFWEELGQADLALICRRTGCRLEGEVLYLPFWNRLLALDLGRHTAWFAEQPEVEPDFRTCMTALLYLLRVDPEALGEPVSPLSLPGATTFFTARGPHALPAEPLEARFGTDLEAFREAGRRLMGEPRPLGDAAMAFTVLPGLVVEVILWAQDEEFPAKASFTVPARLERFWQLDAVLGLLQLVVQELLKAAA